MKNSIATVAKVSFRSMNSCETDLHVRVVKQDNSLSSSLGDQPLTKYDELIPTKRVCFAEIHKKVSFNLYVL